MRPSLCAKIDSAFPYEELAADRIAVHDVVEGLVAAIVAEDYPAFPKGHAFWFWSTTRQANRFTSSGAFRRDRPRQRF